MQPADTLIKARQLVPVEPAGVVLTDHAVVITDGRITDLLPTGQAIERYQPAITVELERHVLIPGLVNAHTHAGMTLFRGIADDLPLMAWLKTHIWPAEQRWVSEEFTHDAVQLAIAEMLRGGTTCFNEMYYFPEVVAHTSAQCGMRACIGLIVLDFPTPYAENADDYLAKGLMVYDQYRDHPLIRTAFAPHAPYTVSDTALDRIRILADELDLPVHIHLHETADEIRQSLERHGVRPIQRLQALGLISPALLAVHMTQLEGHEIELLATAGAHVIHCPESNLKLASGFCPAHRLLEAGVNVALGTDGAASNNDLDLFGEMRSAALLAKGVAADPTALPAHVALRMATLNGAQALGIAAETGSIEIGKFADLVAVTLDELETLPCYDPISQLVYATGRDKVTDVWIAGQHLLRARRLTTLDEPALRQRTQNWNRKIATQPPYRPETP